MTNEQSDELSDQIDAALAKPRDEVDVREEIDFKAIRAAMSRLTDLERLREAVDKSLENECPLPVRIRAALAKLTTTQGETK